MKTALQIVVEAKRGRKANAIKSSGTDYTSEIEDEEVEDQTDSSAEETEDEELQSTDYTEESPDTDDEPETVEDETDDELQSTDYTEENPDDETTDAGDTTDTGDELESNDYTEESPDDEPGGDTEGGDDELESTDYTEENPDDSDSTSDSTDSSMDDTSSNGEGEDDIEKRQKAELFTDCTELYDLFKNTINKLSTYNKTTIFVNKILIQISKNLNESRKALWNFIVYEFDKGNYVTNLTRYNYFIENLRINIDMLKKTMDYVSNSETFK